MYDKRNRQVVWEQRAKKKAEEKAKLKVMRDKAKAAESKKKVINSADKFKDPEAKEEKWSRSEGGAESEGEAESKDGASAAASATGMKIKDQQPSESDISDDG